MGFFQVDRQIVTAILGAFLTYLIILMQWPSVDEEALPEHVNKIEDFVMKIEVMKYSVTISIFQ